MTPPLPARSLSAKLLLLTIAFVMLAEVLIFLPSIARFRVGWLEERLAAGHLAALTVQAAPGNMVTKELQMQLLAIAGARMVDLQLPGDRVLMLGETSGETAAREEPRLVDLRTAGAVRLIADAVLVLVSQPERSLIRVVGQSPKDSRATVTLTLDEAPLATALLDFSGRILLLSIVISLITASLVFLSLNALLVRPMRRITASLVAFREAPDDPAATPVPSGRSDEVGTAERELASMQEAVRTALRQQARLAALGTAVTKINHDLRNILATAAIVSERLAISEDPEVRRVTPRLMRALDQAAELCEQTLAYTRDGAVPLSLSPVDLAELAREVGTELLPREEPDRSWEVAAPPGTVLPADRGQLHRALLNLGRNAFQAGAHRVAVGIRPGVDGRTVLTVEDDGPGLPPRARENLFTPFAGSARKGGVGLGLAIAREILRAHGGELRLVASGAGGTVFALELPATERLGADPLPAQPLSHKRSAETDGGTRDEDGKVDRGSPSGPVGAAGTDHGLARR
ncbi:sensor histidine kinase [Arenibaculum pallidiluteum]|uniref:sensor histidine kinase n=1 Tax=Arenibaculum pallidiluteum TaxID=2812559 RepID=UPI001A960B57|nr:HAMP domain-containing sensor histidine kinase [Arenibaculum pallidiluteum]